jgi:hypothetical protein
MVRTPVMRWKKLPNCWNRRMHCFRSGYLDDATKSRKMKGGEESIQTVKWNEIESKGGDRAIRFGCFTLKL